MLLKNTSRIHLFALVGCLLMVHFASAQTSSNSSPYSKFGLGDLRGNDFAFQRSMSGIGIALQDVTQLNLTNPASLGALELTTFEVGADLKLLQLSNSSQTLYKNTGNLSYAALGFPVSKRVGMSIGILPFSRTDYKIINENTGNDLYIERYQGNGGLNRVVGSVGVQIGKNIFAGTEVSYLFGTKRTQHDILFNNNILQTYHLKLSDAVSANGFYLKGGLQYKAKLKPDHFLILGVTSTLGSRLASSRERLVERFKVSGEGIEVVRDSVSQTSTSQQLAIPLSYGAGLTYNTSKLTLGVDMNLQNWSTFNLYDEDKDMLTKSGQVALGLSYTPDPQSVGVRRYYWKTVKYQGGLRYSQTPLKINGQQLKEYGLSFGLGLPVSDRISYSIIHVSIDGGLRGTLANNLIRERFVRLTLGFSLSDRWFIKPQYD